MNTSDRFTRFAAECEVMAKFACGADDKAIWNRLAQRWIRCAELLEERHHPEHRRKLSLRRQTFLHNLSH
jgi:hypothetical protein